MKTLALLSLTFTFLFYGVHPATLTFTNNCPYTVWPATVIRDGGRQLSTTGFELPTKATQPLYDPAPFNGRFWGRTECSTDSTGTFTCATGECGSGEISCNGAEGNPPVSLIELNLGKYYGQDFYDISLVDGFNVPVSISPRGGFGNACIPASCARNVNSNCPNELAVKGQDGNSVIGCKSACVAFNRPEYCCTDTCKPTNYSKFFKNQCPQAYSYALDDSTSTFSCTSGANYDITFCPDGRIYNRSWGNCPSGVHPATLTFTNNCPYTVWPATVIRDGGRQLSTTGFELPTKATQPLYDPAPFNGRFWGRTECSTDSTGTDKCATGECGSGEISCNGAEGNPPVSLIELNLGKYYGQDFYDISLVDGFNVPVSISPRGGFGNACIPASCARNVNSNCPNELAVKGQDGNSVIGCKSACVAFNRPEYCCTDTCKPTNYSKFFKNQCPQAYSYALDDSTSTFSCTSGANYDITFCPDGRIYNRSWGNCPSGFLNFSVYNNNLSFPH
ncbi:hypothetical protein JCGZ_08436 [Jatropha curcas]|uniref:Thaumatin-like protein n=1 Tax=Jatropha curcas TaxID=180498 RepID=A0A067KWH8_JATCU|nr:hypothetical protein JCGZ_08436 [Jatropha curcas]